MLREPSARWRPGLPGRPLALYLVWWKHTPECHYMAPEKMLENLKMK